MEGLKGNDNTQKTKREPRANSKHKQALMGLEQYKILVDTVEDYAIFMLDTEGYIISWNKGAQKNKGWTADEIIGQHFSKFYQPEDIMAEKPAKELFLAIQRGRVEDEDWRVRKDGTKFWANVVITTLYDSEGKHIGFAKVTRDLTERKQQEDAVRRANILLRQQQRELELMNKSKDEFIALASHQLRTPATATKQLLGILTEGLYGDLPPEIENIVKKAYSSNERQIYIVNSLLKVAQIDAGKVILRKVPVDFTQMLHDILEEQADTFQSRKQEARLESHTTSIRTHADPEHIRMAIGNLIDNASKYTPAGGAITVKASQNIDSVFISVADNGVGISEEDAKRLFTKFVRLPNEMSQKVGGSGLGLYWLGRVVELHGGTVEIESEVGKGTTFTIILPKVLEEDS